MLSMSIREIIESRNRFHRAPDATGPEELPLRAKQALIDEILHGMLIRAVECYEEDGRYMVTKGWAQLQAILDYTDGKFPTWTAEEMRQWKRNQV